MKLNSIANIMTIFFGASTLVCTVISTINSIKNADRRAAIAGKACGEVLAIKSQSKDANIVYL